MGQEAREMKIIDARTISTTTGTGLVVLTTNFRFFVVNNIKDPRIRRFPDIPGIYVSLYTRWDLMAVFAVLKVLILPLAAGQPFMAMIGRHEL